MDENEQKKTNQLLQQLISLEKRRDEVVMTIATYLLENGSSINQRYLAGLILEQYQL